MCQKRIHLFLYRQNAASLSVFSIFALRLLSYIVTGTVFAVE